MKKVSINSEEELLEAITDKKNSDTAIVDFIKGTAGVFIYPPIEDRTALRNELKEFLDEYPLLELRPMFLHSDADIIDRALS